MYIKVKVFPDSKKVEVIKKSPDTYVVYTKSKAERGEANEDVQKFLSQFLHIPIYKLRMVKGGKSTSKIYEITDS